jgi:predicted O-methyltransferase YrrM
MTTAGAIVYQADWTSQMAADWQREIVPRLAGRPISILEIGVFEGRTAAWFIENLCTVPGCEYVGVDPFTGAPELKDFDLARLKETAWQSINDARLRGSDAAHDVSAYIIDLPSFQVLPRFPARSFDLVYVDGDHSYAAAYSDIYQAMRLVRPGGVILVDDIDWPGPARAVRELLGAKNPNRERQLIVKVPHEPA